MNGIQSSSQRPRDLVLSETCEMQRQTTVDQAYGGTLISWLRMAVNPIVLRIVGRKSDIEVMVMRVQQHATAMRLVLMLQTARLKCRNSNFSGLTHCNSLAIRDAATRRSSGARKEAVPGDLGMRKKAETPTTKVIMPSKKKMLRQVWMIPQGGIRDKPVARRPPKAPLQFPLVRMKYHGKGVEGSTSAVQH